MNTRQMPKSPRPNNEHLSTQVQKKREKKRNCRLDLARSSSSSRPERRCRCMHAKCEKRSHFPPPPFPFLPIPFLSQPNLPTHLVYLIFYRSSSSRSMASGFALCSSAGAMLPLRPDSDEAATKPAGARAWRSSAAIASSPSAAASEVVGALPRATACEAMKLTSVLGGVSLHDPEIRR